MQPAGTEKPKLFLRMRKSVLSENHDSWGDGRRAAYILDRGPPRLPTMRTRNAVRIAGRRCALHSLFAAAHARRRQTGALQRPASWTAAEGFPAGHGIERHAIEGERRQVANPVGGRTHNCGVREGLKARDSVADRSVLSLATDLAEERRAEGRPEAIKI